MHVGCYWGNLQERVFIGRPGRIILNGSERNRMGLCILDSSGSVQG
jgi:hypothetical protein